MRYAKGKVTNKKKKIFKLDVIYRATSRISLCVAILSCFSFDYHYVSLLFVCECVCVQIMKMMVIVIFILFCCRCHTVQPYTCMHVISPQNQLTQKYTSSEVLNRKTVCVVMAFILLLLLCIVLNVVQNYKVDLSMYAVVVAHISLHMNTNSVSLYLLFSQ